jgi:hypothetical protein
MMRHFAFAIMFLLLPSAAFANFAIFQLGNSGGSGGGGGSTIFQADTTKSIASITPSITCLQNGTLQTPAFIQCSASGTTASGSSNPYIDLQYVWTDNNSSPDSFTLPSPIGTRSSSTQYGPEYVQVFRNAGTFTVTLTVRGCTSGHPSTAYTGGGGTCNGNAITTATTTQTVTVSAWSGTDFYFNTSTGSDSNGCTLGSPCLTPNKCASVIEGGSNRRCNFDCGQTFDGTVGSSLRLSANATYSHARVQPGGADCPGANPIITISSGGNNCMEVDQNGAGGVKSDVVISSITCTNSGTASGTELVLVSGNNTGGGSVNNVYLDNITATNSRDNSPFIPVNIAEAQTTQAATYQGVVLWNVSTTNPVSALNTESGIIGGTHAWYSIVGGTQQGSGAFSAVLAHHVYMHCGGHCLARWINTGPSCSGGGCTPTRDSCIKTSYDQADGDGSAFTSSFWLLTENYCQSVANLGGGGNNSNDPTVSTIDQWIAQQNVLVGISGGVFPATVQNSAVRDNWACLTGPNSIGISVGQFYNPSVPGSGHGEDAVLASNIYRNFSYNNTANIAITYDDIGNNVWTNPQRAFDNILQTDNASGKMFNLPSTNFTSIGSFVDYNTYYAPNQAGNFLQNAGSGVTFAAWKALGWDTHGANTNPGFSSPSTCGFGSWPY